VCIVASVTAAEAAQGLAARVTLALSEAVKQRGVATLWVSGGSTPVPFFQALASQPLPWSQVQLGLVDDRWCDPSEADSNEGLLRRHLLVGAAAQARFMGWHRAGVSEPLAVAPALAAQAAAWPWPADVVVLGVGGDGHTASWFPGTAQYAQAVSALVEPRCVVTDAPALPNVPRPRVTLTLGAVRDSRLICVHATGVGKAEVLARAWSGGRSGLPIGQLWAAPMAEGGQMPPVEVHWAPG
jgi:6-phosphogluconolactonase